MLLEQKMQKVTRLSAISWISFLRDWQTSLTFNNTLGDGELAAEKPTHSSSADKHELKPGGARTCCKHNIDIITVLS